jgi:hypothetical protein
MAVVLTGGLVRDGRSGEPAEAEDVVTAHGQSGAHVQR